MCNCREMLQSKNQRITITKKDPVFTPCQYRAITMKKVNTVDCVFNPSLVQQLDFDLIDGNSSLWQEHDIEIEGKFDCIYNVWCIVLWIVFRLECTWQGRYTTQSGRSDAQMKWWQWTFVALQSEFGHKIPQLNIISCSCRGCRTN